jgi:hypothetical protein
METSICFFNTLYDLPLSFKPIPGGHAGSKVYSFFTKRYTPCRAGGGAALNPVFVKRARTE